MAHFVQDPIHLICVFIVTPSFSRISAHERLFVVLVGVISWEPQEEDSEIAMQEFSWRVSSGTSPGRGNRAAGQREKGLRGSCNRGLHQSYRSCGAGMASLKSRGPGLYTQPQMTSERG